MVCDKVSQDILEIGFVIFGTIDTLGRIILCCWGCLVHCMMVSSVPGLNPFIVSSVPPPVVTTQNVSGHYQMSPGGQNCPWLRTDAFDIEVFHNFISDYPIVSLYTQ